MNDSLDQSMQLSPMEPRTHEYSSVRDMPMVGNRVTIKKAALFDSELLAGEGSALSTRVTSLVGGVDESMPSSDLIGRARAGRGRGNEAIRIGEETELGELGEGERQERGASKTPKKRGNKEQKSASKVRRSQKSKGSKKDSTRKRKKEEGEDEEEKPVARNRKAGEFDLSGQDLRAIDQSDVIMTFAAHSKFEFLNSFDRCLLKNKDTVTL